VLTSLNEYANLINFGLLVAIIGWLFHISKISRKSLIDQYNAKLATKDQEIQSIRSQLQLKQVLFESQLNTIEHTRSFYERLSSLQGDERIDALKLEYEMRLESLDTREQNLEIEIEEAVSTEKQVLRKEIDNIRAEKEMIKENVETVISIDKDTVARVSDIALKLIQLTMRF